ncbi:MULTISPECIES: DNA cytosine methyltransferase [Streptomyces]|uniref:DNA (cytosine-5-)-methyltransferase n=1 Tax=Streptomyces sudanensis TaxID=436397 RepID=A0ABY4THM2_9ACTN|nr:MULTISPECIES: DNA cytosine methyltransferase [Streptomyces]URN17705.1 DNA cytosine methyltransferase [Streptomyces sudanensis]
MTSPDAPARFLEHPYILDLFAGPGGLDVAAHILEVPSLGIEWDRDACETRYAAGLPTWHADVSEVRRKRFGELPEGLNVLAGGPPCQTYSVAGNGAGRKALDDVEKLVHELVEGVGEKEIDKRLEEMGGDPRTALVLEPLRYAIAALGCSNRKGRPFDVIVLEQVPAVRGLWGVYKQALEKGLLREDGTRVRYEVAEVVTLPTEAYGVPQTRRRAILIARLAGHGVPPLPDPTHHTYNPFDPKQGGPEDERAVAHAAQTALQVEGVTPRRPWVSMWEVLRATKQRPEGRKSAFEIVSNYGSGGDPKKRGVRTSGQPSFTVTGKVSRNAVRHPDGTPHTPARMTISEAGILQTFPPNYPWSGGDRSQQVGNAVPPLFGMHVLAAALALPLPPEERLRENWRNAADEERATLRKEGCGVSDGCGPDCPKPEDQSPPSTSVDSSRPRTGASAKRSEK